MILVVLYTVYDYLLLLYTRLFLPCPVVLLRYLEDSYDLGEWLLWSSVVVLALCLKGVAHWSTACLVSTGAHLLLMLYWFGPECRDEVSILRAAAGMAGLCGITSLLE